MWFLTYFYLQVASAQVSRNPGSIPPELNFSGKSYQELVVGVGEIISKKVKFEKNNDGIIIHVPNFVLNNESNAAAFVCSQYSKVKLVFAADGIAVDGEIPKFNLSKPCQESNDVGYLNKIFVPFGKIKESIKGNGAGLPEPKDEFQLTHLLDSWPSKWHLETIYFIKHKGTLDSLVIDLTHIKLKNPRLTFTW